MPECSPAYVPGQVGPTDAMDDPGHHGTVISFEAGPQGPRPCDQGKLWRSPGHRSPQRAGPREVLETSWRGHIME